MITTVFSKHALYELIEQEMHEINTKSIIFAWVPSHTGIEGNYQPDHNAKEAANDSLLTPSIITVALDLNTFFKALMTEFWNNI